MTDEDRIAALFAEANPVPSLDLLDPLEPLGIDPLEGRSKRSSVMTDLKTDRPESNNPRKVAPTGITGRHSRHRRSGAVSPR